MQIKSITGAVLFTDENAATLKGAVVNAIAKRAYLSGAYLSGAYLSGADLSGADLKDTQGAALAIAKTRIVGAGSLIGWKKCKYNVIVKLEIPADAARSHAFGRKCRAEFVKVLEVIGAETGISGHDATVNYRAGEIVRCHKWDTDWTNECSGGIHFFITREEAEDWIV